METSAWNPRIARLATASVEAATALSTALEEMATRQNNEEFISAENLFNQGWRAMRGDYDVCRQAERFVLADPSGPEYYNNTAVCYMEDTFGEAHGHDILQHLLNLTEERPRTSA